MNMTNTPIKLTLLFSSTLTIMAGATIAPSLPQIQQVFIENPNSEILTKLILTIPALFIAIFSPIVGALIDRFGRIKIMLGSLVVYGITGSSGYFLDDIYSILASRALLGIGVTGVLTSTITLIADYFKGEERNAFMGLQGAFVALGGVVSITLGGILAEISWRAPFLIYFSSFIVFIPAYIYLFEPDVKREETTEKNKSVEPYPQILVAIIYFTASIGMMLFYIIPVQIPFYFKEHTGASNTLIGLAIAASTLSSAIVSLNYKRIKAKWDYSMIYFFSFLFLGLGFIVIFYVRDYYMLLLGLLIGGIGMGVLIPNSNVWVVSLSPESMRGRLVGGLSTAVFIGQFISPFLIQSVIESTSTSGIFAFSGIGLLMISLAYLGYSPLTKKSLKFQAILKKRIF
jgi:MFS family permease